MLRAVAADQPARDECLAAGTDRHRLGRLFDAFHATPAPDGDAERGGAAGEDGFDARHVRGEAADAGRQAIRPVRVVDAIMEDRNAREMPGRRARLAQPVRGGGRVSRERGVAQVVEQVAAVEPVDARRGEPAQPERQRLERRMRIGRAFEHEHRAPRQPQLAGEEQPDRAGAGNDDVMICW